MPEERLKILGQRIRELREERNLTQAQLAELSDLSTNYLGEVERADSQVTLETLFTISDALQVNPSLLFTPLDHPLGKEEVIRRIKELLDVLATTD